MNRTNDWVVAGNWKMNMDRDQCEDLLNGLLERMEEWPDGVDLLVAPAYPFLSLAVNRAMGSHLLVGAQNCHHESAGAYTGEVSTGMLSSIGVNACIVGHSERRELFGETDAMVSNKVDALLEEGLLPIFCCGEPQEVREAKEHFNYVGEQLKNALFHLGADRFAQVVIAYEPIWAIGTGLTATPQEAQEMHAHIRQLVEDKYSLEVAAHLRILYGGSCKPTNAAELFACPDVNGGLIGGASLNVDDFMAIAQATRNS